MVGVMCLASGAETTPPRACARGGGWILFLVFDAADSVVAGTSPGGEYHGEILGVDHAVIVEVCIAGRRAVVA